MTARILVSLGAIAIIAAAAVILTYQRVQPTPGEIEARNLSAMATACLLYTSDAADERSSVDLGGRRILKTQKKNNHVEYR